MKKAQMETIGLVIIVLLIIFGALFFVVLIVLPPKNPSKTIESLEANNILSALLKTTTCSMSVFDAIKECQQKTTVCNQDACTYIQDSIRDIMEASLDQKTDYKLEVEANNNPLFSTGDCKTGIASAPYSIPSKGVVYTIKLKLCSKNP